MGIDMPRAPLDQSAIAAALSQYWRVSVVDLTASTQDDLMKKITAGDSRNGEVIIANYQSAGRGRLDRTFSAPASTALLFSLYLIPERSRENWGFIPLLAGLSVARTLSEADQEISIKWPNDLLIGEKKVAGIISTLHGQGVIVGIGLNVSMKSEELPVPSATSLELEGFTTLDRNQLIAAILNSLEKDFIDWDHGSSFCSQYLAHSSTIGSMVQIELPDGVKHQSKALSIDELGQLHLEDGQCISVGDVIHLR
jgi:BirA family biotin operon repressor/biotin-[acetyl-CoA-carboxylase] ligase